MGGFNTKGKLFKYMPYNQYLLNLLINEKFWLSPLDKLNDPFEGGFLIQNLERYQNKEFIENLLKSLRKSWIDDATKTTQLDRALKDKYYLYGVLSEYVNRHIRNRFSITCFSRTAINVKMWSHYADSHKGVCLIFDEQKLRESIYKRSLKAMFDNVSYSYNLPVLSLIHTDTLEEEDGSIRLPHINTFLFCKQKKWCEEKEVRLIEERDFDILDDRYFYFDSNCLIGIIFGYRIELDNYLTICNLLRSRTIEYYTSRKKIDKPGLSIKKLKIS